MLQYLSFEPMRVAGIPATIGIISYTPFRPGRYTGPWEHCYPDEAPEIEWDMCDRNGRRAAWLERKLSATDRDAITTELLRRAAHGRECAA